MNDDAALVEAAYEAYGEQVGWVNYAGYPMPTWGQLDEPRRRAWIAAVRCVVAQLRERQAP